MSEWPVHVEPLDRAVLDLLCSLPSTWGDYDAEALTGSEQEAIRLMVRAGLVELRLILRGTMDNRDEYVELTLTVTGEYDGADIWRAVLEQMPEWLDADGRIQGRCRMWSEPRQIRLTDQGETARHDYQNQTPENPSSVCAFVRRVGFFAYRPDVEARVRVERAECASSDEEVGAAPAAQIVAAQAIANASVGDITFQNHINIDVGQVAEAVFAKMRDEPQKGSADDRAQSGPESESPHADDEPTESSILESTQYDGPHEDEHDDRYAMWLGKRLYLGRDTQLSRLFWLLAKPLGRARRYDEVQKAVDGMITDETAGSTPEEIQKAARRVRKAVSKLRAQMRDDGFDDHFVIVRDGGNEHPEYSMVPRYSHR